MNNQFIGASSAEEANRVRYDEGQGAWIVTDLGAARTVLGRHDLFGTDAYRSLQPDIADIKRFLSADRNRHRLLRRFMVKAFSQRRMPEVDASILQPVAEELVAQFSDMSRIDLQDEYITPYTRAAMYGVIGLPDTAGDELVAAFRVANSFLTVEGDVRRGTAAVALLRQMAERACEEPDPRFGAASLLGLARKEEWTSQGLDRADLVCFMMSLIEAAAVKADRDITATTLRRVADLPDKLQSELGADGDRLVAAAEEALRLQDNGGVLPRVALQTTSLGEHEIRAGDRVLVVLGKVGLDPQGFVEPHEYRPGRSDLDRAITFGVGIHRCPGEHIAKLICVRACWTLLRRYHLSPVDGSSGGFVVDIQPRAAS
ncbi:cytochrome P450 [Nocardiopsis sp. EMB25]|uniref:cytochrome P450 n=1 Tax=Nocardiopsis sp. EMB25 TaxID=2835867 RepID=UPI0022841159|nr:cytochrome P450 [Nocardiopsis sp. EMB25]MCY9787136.1 cytochrome P450 [Nocardiopsis sp. EMB25]